jgi:hypothetical protein
MLPAQLAQPIAQCAAAPGESENNQIKNVGARLVAVGR